ncbi:MAG: AI-2E family transporter [Clostridium sp.]|uniref:AI-2E family transporter n=1 Tax=Clostridium sp. TaxID=1506 RepID=UPI0025B9F98E|nr:AI-2E family transporter [Clostridium sp.]MCH3963242.1 AI-2E family transporter [Clostridium sp.]MCI1717214.1 AI-2E family transporter [Clostridium sp.]MCI1801554.1 AI-2E family transporter [Clostridium sp.]MCI1815400.1 AI-2E family transporter [Clostridium sp.]MCI1872303.1 AI-2E family transporter [Clostridium sp.]
MNFFTDFFSKESTKRALLFVAIILFFYTFQSLLNLFLLTFLFSYIMNSLQSFILRGFKKVTPAIENLITSILYAALFSSIIFIIVKYIPQLINQTKSLVSYFSELQFTDNDSSDIIQKYLVDMLGQIDIKSYIKSGFNASIQLVSDIGKWSINIFISIMLSMFFLLEKRTLAEFTKKFEHSKISGLYKYLVFFGKNFLNSFGKVVQAQLVIAFVNTILSVIMLSILDFPQLLTLGFMIFVLSLIPVAGVIISLVPLSLIAFNIGGLTKVVYVLIMVAIIHCIESYILNPKLMSSKVKIPIFFTFIILIVSEHILGVWGLLIGIPLFMFILDLLNVKIHD